MSEVTRILDALAEGDSRAAERLLPAVYEELRRLAAQRLSREKSGQTLQATALVHEAYIRLVKGRDQEWDGRGHFFAAAAEAMRRILIERARRKKRLKHGGGRRRLELSESDLATGPPSIDLLTLDEALTKLGEEDPQKADLVKLRYFAGLPIREAAELLGISHATAERYWTYARAWLHHEISKGDTTRDPAPPIP